VSRAAQPGPPSSLVVMGVSGCGKSAVGAALASRLGWRFADGDDFHPPANVAKMRTGVALDDADRAPWLDRLNALLRHSAAKREPLVLACSALKQRYRDALAARVPGLRFVFLDGDAGLIAQRLAQRQHRYMPASLLRSQFDALEPPADAIRVDVAEPLDQVVARVVAAIRGADPAP